MINKGLLYSVTCLSLIVLLCGCGKNDKVEQTEAEVRMFNETTEVVLQQNDLNKKIATDNRDVVVDFLVKGRFDDSVKNIISEDVLKTASEYILEDTTVIDDDKYIETVADTVLPLSWDTVNTTLDGVNLELAILWSDYENKEGIFEKNQIHYNEYRDENGELQIDEVVVEEPKWVFDNPIIVEEGYYIAVGSEYTTQFLVIMGSDNYKVVAKVYWKDGKIHMMERVLYE